MRLNHFIKFASFGLGTILFKWKRPILGTIIVTDRCNLSCKHCAVNNLKSVIYPYEQIRSEMISLYQQGIRILFFCGGETFLWQDKGKTLRDLVIEAKQIGFMIVNVVTNGTFPIDLPEADMILLSLDGGREAHNMIRGHTFDTILTNIRNATRDNICIYMAINRMNKDDIKVVSDLARKTKNIRAISFNFHTPYPGTEQLRLSVQEKEECCRQIAQLMDEGYPVFNLKSAFPYIIHNNFKTPCYQCVVMEDGKQSVCGRCIDIEGLCNECGYFFAAEYSLIFSGHVKVMADMLRTYLKYI